MGGRVCNLKERVADRLRSANWLLAPASYDKGRYAGTDECQRARFRYRDRIGIADRPIAGGGVVDAADIPSARPVRIAGCRIIQGATTTRIVAAVASVAVRSTILSVVRSAILAATLAVVRAANLAAVRSAILATTLAVV